MESSAKWCTQCSKGEGMCTKCMDSYILMDGKCMEKSGPGDMCESNMDCASNNCNEGKCCKESICSECNQKGVCKACPEGTFLSAQKTCLADNLKPNFTKESYPVCSCVRKSPCC